MELSQNRIRRSGIKMGEPRTSWKAEKAKDITLCVTEDCNLACKYCYMTGKNTKNKMSLETAKKAVDFFLSNREDFYEEAVIWNFIGGEPFLEIELIDQISDYIKIKMYELNHPWFNSYMFNFSSNGVYYDKPEVQEYIRKNKHHVSIGLSVDGNKIKHDMQRIKVDGSGSYEDVVKNVPLWVKQFPTAGTKATFSHSDLEHLKDSVIHLWDLGIKDVSANVVFEDVWHEGDDIIYEQQLKSLADYVLEHTLWDKFSVRFFDPAIGYPISEAEKKLNFCGAGKMVAVDVKGNLFPCVRFYDLSLENRDGLAIGHVDGTLNKDLLRPFEALSLTAQSPAECIDCEVASGCSWCTGANYDTADSETIYQRATFICKMHKANVRAKNYFWEKLYALEPGLFKEEQSADDLAAENRHLLVLTSDTAAPHCSYRNWNNGTTEMDREMIKKSLDFASKHNLKPVLLGDIKDISLLSGTDPVTFRDSTSGTNENPNQIYIYDNNGSNPKESLGIANILINPENLTKLPEIAKELLQVNYRINVILENIETWDNNTIETYENILDALINLISESYKNGSPYEVNVLTDILYAEGMTNCDAGQSSYSVAPNGKIYICPAFYFNNPDDHIGSLDDGISIPNKQLLDLENAPICGACDAYHCQRCKFLNKKMTKEINTPSQRQCHLSHIERKKSLKLQNILNTHYGETFERTLQEIDYMDPLEKIKSAGSVYK